MKKGFTLVEVLCVIAIIAVLSVLVLPNVSKSLDESRKETFISEAENIYKNATSSYLIDKAKGYYEVIYSNANFASSKKLDVSSRDGFEYLIKINGNGEVYYFLVQDKNYTILLENDVKLKDIHDGVEKNEVQNPISL